nr:hypothetical protein [Mesorhizobium sp. B2-6-5]
MGDNLERIVDGLQGSLLQVDVPEIIAHEGDEPNGVVDFLDAEPLTGEHMRDVDFLPMHADAAAVGDENVAVVERVVQVLQAGIGS